MRPLPMCKKKKKKNNIFFKLDYIPGITTGKK